jgi:hypothetical protein
MAEEIDLIEILLKEIPSDDLFRTLFAPTQDIEDINS